MHGSLIRVLTALGILFAMLGSASVTLVRAEGPDEAAEPRSALGPAGAETDSLTILILLAAASDGKEAEERQAGESGEKEEKPEKEEEKERHEKKKEPKERKKPEPETSSSMFGCFASCLFDAILDGICSSFGDDSESDWLSYDITHEYDKPLTGVIVSRQASPEEVAALYLPGGEGAASGIAYLVPVGAEVLVWRRAIVGQDAPWLEISRPHTESIYGWVRAYNVMIEDIYDPDMLMAGTPPDGAAAGEEQEGDIPGRPIGWLRGDVSWYTPLGKPLSGEYDGRGYQGRGMIHLLTGGSLQIGAGVGFAQAHGEPEAVYETPSMFDEPLDSRLSVFSIEIQIGQHLVGGGRTSFTWGMGPTVFRVKERAEIAFTEFEGGIEVGSGVRTDTMTKWKLGLDARISVEYACKGKAPIGVVTGFSFIPWDSEGKESLALDWLDKDYFITYQLGMTFGGLFF